MSRKPNVVFIFSDQHRRDASGCYGHPRVRTPNIDRLAASGVRFTQAYAAAPICHPGRSAMMTGRQVHRCCDPTRLEQHLDLSLPNLGTIFRQAGYATAAFGKVHVPGEDEEHDLGFDERALRIYTPMHNDYQHTIGLENFWKYASYLPQYRPPSNPPSRNGINPTNSPIELEDELIFDHMVADRAIEFLTRVSGVRVQVSGGQYAQPSENLVPHHVDEVRDKVCDEVPASRGGTPESRALNPDATVRPFFLWVGLEKPHNEMYAPKRFHDLYDPDEMTLPANIWNPRDRLPASISDNPTFPILTPDVYTDRELRCAMAAYFANVSYMDEQLGRVLDALDQLDLAEDTIVVYSSDHGENLFSHQIVQKHCFFEEAVGVPLILRIPGKTRPGTSRTALATLVDVLPTLCEACDLPVPEGVDGRSLLPVIADGVAVHDAVFSEYYTTGIAERMIRTGKWKYVHSHGDLHQLYDREADPRENVNLIDDPAYGAIAAELDARVCKDWAIPDMSRVHRPRGDTRHGQRGCPTFGKESLPGQGDRTP